MYTVVVNMHWEFEDLADHINGMWDDTTVRSEDFLLILCVFLERQSETQGALYVGCFRRLGQNQDGGQSDLYTLN